MEVPKTNGATDVPSEDEKQKNKDEEILELAKKELMRDVKCASIRAEQYGAHCWAKPSNYRPSQRFLKHMLMSASSENERIERRKQDIRLRVREKHDRDNYIDSKRRKSSDVVDNTKTHSRHKYKNLDRTKST